MRVVMSAICPTDLVCFHGHSTGTGPTGKMDGGSESKLNSVGLVTRLMGHQRHLTGESVKLKTIKIAQLAHTYMT